jgi:hypothetical protein
MGIVETVFLVFLILKLVGVVSWSWWVVFIPLFVAGVIDFGIICVWGAAMVLAWRER